MTDHVELPPPHFQDAKVPCGTCHLCCKNTPVLILDEYGDNPESFHTNMIGPDGDIPILAMKPNGDCVYLGADGCTIHDKAPYMCRIYDCREQHKMYTKAQREALVKQGKLSKDVLRRGAGLIHQGLKAGNKSQKIVFHPPGRLRSGMSK